MSFGTKGCMYCEGECNKECLPKQENKQETSNEVGKYFADNADATIVIERPGTSADELKLIDFLKYIKEVHTDEYGQLQICDNGDELDPTIERVVKDYLKKK